MSITLPSQDAAVFSQRRRVVQSGIHGRAALFYAGNLRPRNYPANVYPFRADSHFLYLTGCSIPGAVLMLTEGGSKLFLEPPTPGDALWHGESPDFDAIRRATGVESVFALSDLEPAISNVGGAAEVATLPTADPIARLRQAQQLGRNWTDPDRTDVLSPIDGSLADSVIAARLLHDAAAIEQLHHAAAGTKAAHLAGMAVTRAGILEHEVCAAMEAKLSARGQTTAYGSIVTVRGDVLHNFSHDNRLQDGDLLLADVGAEHEGWAGDVTRTWPVSGRFSPTQRAIYEIVVQAQLDAIALVRSGNRYRDVHLRAAQTIARGLVDEGILRGDVDNLVERGAHALFFPHGIGHLLGLDVHDMEGLGDRASYGPDRARSKQFGLSFLRLDLDLRPGMAVTVEPGIYFVPAILNNNTLIGPFVADGSLDLAGVARFSDVRGIRVEDDILCTDEEPEVLSVGIPKTLCEVESTVGTATIV